MLPSKQIKRIILELLSDGKEHTIQEIREHLSQNNIQLEKSSTLLRNVMYTLKKENQCLLNPTRGTYQLLLCENNCQTNHSDFECAIIEIEKAIHDCKNFNWYSCSNSELEIARSKVKTLLKLSNTISTELQ